MHRRTEQTYLAAGDLGAPLGERATLVQFSTAFCQPCRATRRILQRAAGMVGGVVHVELDTESRLELARRLGVLRTPTVLVLDADGRLVRRASGQPRTADVLAALGEAVAGPGRPPGGADAPTTNPHPEDDTMTVPAGLDGPATTSAPEALRQTGPETAPPSGRADTVAVSDAAALDSAALDAAALDGAAFDAARLREAFRQHAGGVAVITAADGRPVGFTATSLSSLSARPPLLSFGMGTASSSWPVLAGADFVGVHVLAEDQEETAALFARSGADRFAAPTRWHEGPHGVPVLEGVLAWMVCRIVARIPAGDHHLVVARPVAGETGAPGRPLLYHQGGFNVLRR
ncbi:hypothetical protein GCM10010406_06480 [Streptomyces thermolineatus]|uniref:Flavin reductase like domain-containing protein n=2 Tax=Streptomyces thermolineatus TaxID=44033 RepID=A0ABN3KWI4_9ACTN